MKPISALSYPLFVLLIGCAVSLNARNRAELLQDVPAAIADITGDEVLAPGLPNIPELLELSGVANTLRNSCNYTVFVPPVASLRGLPQEQIDLFLTDGDALRNFLGSYIIPFPIDLIEGRPTDPETGERVGPGREIVIKNLAGEPVLISDDLQTVRINGVPLTGNAAYALNAACYELADRLPELPTLQNALQADPNFSISAALFSHPDIQNRMNQIANNYILDCDDANYSGGGFTCMVPTNDAWTRAGVTAPPSTDSGLSTEVQNMVLNQVIPQYRTTNSFPVGQSIVQTGAQTPNGSGEGTNALINKFPDDLGVQTVLYGNPNQWGTVIESNRFASDCLYHKVSEVHRPQNYTEFRQMLLNASNLDEIEFFATLRQPNYNPPPNATWFAPDNDAFRSLPGGTINQFFNPDFNLTPTIGTPHEFNQGYSSNYWSDLQPGQRSQALVNERGNFTTSVLHTPTGLFVVGDDSTITQTDVPASDGGILHTVNRLITPPPNAYDYIRTNQNTQLFANLAEALNLQGLFIPPAGEVVNVFAPIDSAWQTSPYPDPVAAATQNPQQMENVLRSHITTDLDNWDQLLALPYSLTKDMQYNQIADISGASYYGDYYVNTVEMENGETAEFQYFNRELTVQDTVIITNTGVLGGYVHEVGELIVTDTFQGNAP